MINSDFANGYKTAEYIIQPNYVQGDVSSAALLRIPAYMSATRFISETIAPMRAKVLDADKNENKSHPAAQLLNVRCSTLAGPTKTKETHLVNAVVYGNGYNRIRRDGRGKLLSYENLRTADVIPYIIDGNKWFYVQSTGETLFYNEVVHLYGISHDGLAGANPTSLLTDTFENARILQSYQIKYFKGGASVNGVITVPAGIDGTVFQSMATSWEMLHNSNRPNRTAWLREGATYQDTTSDNQQTQLAELKKASDDDIARVTRVHPSVIFAMTNGTLAGLESSVIRTSLKTWVEQSEDEYTLKFLTNAEINAGVHVKLDWADVFRGDPARSNQLIQGFVSGVFDRDEVRNELDFGPAKQGNLMLVPVNVGQPQGKGQVEGQNGAPDAVDAPQASTAAPDAPQTTAEDRNGVKASETAPEGHQSYAEAQTAPEAVQPPEAARIDLKPLIADVSNRVQTKYRKSIESHKGKEGFSEWVIEFGNKQGDYLRSALVPVVAITNADFTAVVREYEEAVMQETDYPLQEKLNAILSN